MTVRAHGWRVDAVTAIVLSTVLSAVGAWQHRRDLVDLRLPDADDLMRLQQVRDWLAGQRFADLTQHRLGPGPGVAMHWTRLADLGPAGLIKSASPILGRHMAEVVAVTIWPPLLLAVSLFLIARIARMLPGAPPGTAMVVAALAYPASGLFLPGRIDHHALQMVLILGAVLALLSRATFAAGAAIGLAAAGSLTVGMETVPFFGVIGVLIVVAWIAGSVGASGRLLGVGIGTITGLLAARLVFAPLAWDFPACDGFDAASWRAALFLAAATCLLAATKPAGIKPRLAIAGLIGAVALAGALIVSPTCRSPYGMVDPLVARWWLAGVAEAQPLLQATPAVMLGQAGLLLAGIAAGAWWTMRTPDRSRWGAVLAVQTAAFALALVQLRGTYVGALLAAPALAAMISVARTRGAIPLVTAWLASAGVLYPLAARAFEQPVVSDPRACDRVAAVDALAALPPMRVLAPVDLGAAIIARTHHVAIAGPYHRNTTGNRAALLAFLGPGARVGDVVTGVSADAILWCAGTLGDRPAPPGSIGAGAVPPGFHTTPVAGHGLLLWPSRGR